MRKLVVFVVLIGVVAGGIWYLTQPAPREPDMPIINAKIGDKTFRLHAPKTDKGREIGLAAFDSIAEDEGMIFLGMPEGTQGIWMKNMKFDIDVLWVNSDHQIVYIIQGMSKSDQQTVYRNPTNMRSHYVIELANESCNKYGISVGQTVSLNQ